MTQLLLIYTFGDSEVFLLVKHFKPLLEKMKSLSVLYQQSGVLSSTMQHKTFRATLTFGHLLVTHYRVKFPSLVHLIEILVLFPISNATVEHGFSTMRRIKTDWRSRLGEETLDHLLRISTDGPPLSKFDPNPAVEQFFSTPRRPDAAPYGSRK